MFKQQLFLALKLNYSFQGRKEAKPNASPNGSRESVPIATLNAASKKQMTETTRQMTLIISM